ncbi:MAG: hypothetical protein LBO07_02865 [Coriobacteriales bacterium]|nr:hypothetical protein [Coriobacteriales bacterium]
MEKPDNTVTKKDDKNKKKVPLRVKFALAGTAAAVGILGLPGCAPEPIDRPTAEQPPLPPDTGETPSIDPAEQANNPTQPKAEGSTPDGPETSGLPAGIPEPINKNPDHPGFADVRDKAVRLAQQFLEEGVAKEIVNIYIFHEDTPDGFVIIYKDQNGQVYGNDNQNT